MWRNISALDLFSYTPKITLGDMHKIPFNDNTFDFNNASSGAVNYTWDFNDGNTSTAINPSESVEEKVSLSDRFGLWIGFHKMSQDTFLEIVYGYCDEFKISIDKNILKSEALEWSITRGARSGRVAWQFIQDLAGKNKIKIY